MNAGIFVLSDGIITLEDLARYEAEVQYTPLSIKLDELTMYSSRPPASGAVASYIMNILDGMYGFIYQLIRLKLISIWRMGQNKRFKI